jgi:hypothetical protein
LPPPPQLMRVVAERLSPLAIALPGPWLRELGLLEPGFGP